MRASVGRLAEGMPWESGWVAELRRVMDGRRGWVDRDLETVTTSTRYVYSGLAEQERVCARARPHVDSRVAENKYGNFLAMFAASYPGWVFPHWGATVVQGGDLNIPLPTPFLDTGRGGGGGQEQTWEGWRCTGRKEINPSKFGWMGWQRGPRLRQGRGKEGERKKGITLLLPTLSPFRSPLFPPADAGISRRLGSRRSVRGSSLVVPLNLLQNGEEGGAAAMKGHLRRVGH